MQIDEYYRHYDQFFVQYGIDTSVKAREDKLIAEVCEYLEAARCSSVAHADDECIDVVNVALSLARARGIKNILYQCARKLAKTAEKYEKEKNASSKK